jgi:glycerate kinase
MKIILAPDSFKGSLTARQVCMAMATGIRRFLPEAEIIEVPMADGGEGTLETIMASTHGKRITKTVTGPLGDPVNAPFGILPDGQTAIIEMAAASGLTLVANDKRDPSIASSFGTGQLIKAAMDAGCRKIIIGIGGSATNDGGVGIAQALGYRFLDSHGKPLSPGGKALQYLAKIDTSDKDPRLTDLQVDVICDVTNPLTGDNGASLVYGPQKGATYEEALLLDQALANLAERIVTDLHLNVSQLAGGGAAGGAGAGLVAFLGAKLKNGVSLIADLLNLALLLEDADLVITGEGSIDQQTQFGKVPLGVARYAKRFAVPVFAIAGNVAKEAYELHSNGLDGILPIVHRPITLEAAMEHAEEFVSNVTEELVRIYCAGRNSVLNR